MKFRDWNWEVLSLPIIFAIIVVPVFIASHYENKKQQRAEEYYQSLSYADKCMSRAGDLHTVKEAFGVGTLTSGSGGGITIIGTGTASGKINSEPIYFYKDTNGSIVNSKFILQPGYTYCFYLTGAQVLL